MLRLALTPRWLLAALGVLVAVGVCVVAGRWQWQRTQTILAAERAAAAQPVALESVVASDAAQLPDEVIGRPVIVAGTYEAARQSFVPNRVHDGRAGVWVVTGLRLADGTLVAVLRGSLPDASAAGANVPGGRVEVDGLLQPDEAFYAGAQVGAGQIAAIDHADLSRAWGVDVRPGFVTLLAQRPPSTPAPTPVEPTVRSGDIPFPAQNFFYALQWWVFAAFAIGVYLRWLWLDSRPARESASAVEEPAVGSA